MTLPERFKCPPNLVSHMATLMAGEYDLLTPFDGAPCILDVGACVGAFAVWAHARWPDCEVHCYEPNPRVHRILEHNVSALTPKVAVHRVAVTCERTGSVKLFAGKNNLGETSIVASIAGTEDSVDVPTVPIEDLPPADIVKLDCEGYEPELFRRYCATHERPAIMLAEYHSATDMKLFQVVAVELGYRIAKVMEHSYARGVVCMRHEP